MRLNVQHRVLLFHYCCCHSTCAQFDLAGYIQVDDKSTRRWFWKVQASTCLSRILTFPITGHNTLLPWSYRVMSGCFNVILKRGESGINSAERLLSLIRFIEKILGMSVQTFCWTYYIFFLTSVPLMRRRAEQIWLWNKEDFTSGTTLCQKIFPLLSYLR